MSKLLQVDMGEVSGQSTNTLFFKNVQTRNSSTSIHRFLRIASQQESTECGHSILELE